MSLTDTEGKGTSGRGKRKFQSLNSEHAWQIGETAGGRMDEQSEQGGREDKRE